MSKKSDSGIVVDETDFVKPGQNLFQTNLVNLNAQTVDWLSAAAGDNVDIKKSQSADNDNDKNVNCDGNDVQVIKFSRNSELESVEDVSDDTDIISDYIGHYGWWQFFWTNLLGLFQCASTFQIFIYVFQVSF